MESLKVYFLMSSDGKFYRSRGQSGYGDVWTDDINKTRIYVRLPQARARQTWGAKNYLDYETPKIMCLEGLPVEVKGESERATKAVQKLKEREIKREADVVRRKIEALERDKQVAEKKLKELRKRA